MVDMKNMNATHQPAINIDAIASSAALRLTLVRNGHLSGSTHTRADRLDVIETDIAQWEEYKGRTLTDTERTEVFALLKGKF